MLAQSMINIVEMKRIENHNKFQLKMKKSQKSKRFGYYLPKACSTK